MCIATNKFFFFERKSLLHCRNKRLENIQMDTITEQIHRKEDNYSRPKAKINQGRRPRDAAICKEPLATKPGETLT